MTCTMIWKSCSWNDHLRDFVLNTKVVNVHFDHIPDYSWYFYRDLMIKSVCKSAFRLHFLWFVIIHIYQMHILLHKKNVKVYFVIVRIAVHYSIDPTFDEKVRKHENHESQDSEMSVHVVYMSSQKRTEKVFKDLESSRHLCNFDDNVELSNRIDPLRVVSASRDIHLFYLLRRFVNPSRLDSDLHFHMTPQSYKDSLQFGIVFKTHRAKRFRITQYT